MTTRNPNNERYMNSDEKPQGKTRKSAASAKPATKAAASVQIQSKATKKAKSKELVASEKQRRREERRNYLHPQTPEYKKWHRVWVIVLVIALILTLSGLLMSNFLDVDTRTSMTVVIVGDVFLVIAILLDVLKLSKMRSAYAAGKRADKSKKASAQRKEEAKKIAEHDATDKRTQEYKAAQQVKAEEAQAKEEKKKKSKNPFSVKNI